MARIYKMMHRMILGALFGVPMFGLSVFGQGEALASAFDRSQEQCFARAYSKSHLAKNRDQQVTHIRFVHRPSSYDGTHFSLSEGPDGGPPAQRALMDVRFRDGRHMRQDLLCSEQDGMTFCGVECDGGTFDYRFKKNGAMLIDFRARGPIRMQSACDAGSEGRSFWFGDQKEDQLFRLDVADFSACSDLR
ncbi:MAG: hypothetical protein OIF58_11750 [Cohaesibacter sp.]|nr:hypothetical protein [Cohaesibacter sp.]